MHQVHSINPLWFRSKLSYQNYSLWLLATNSRLPVNPTVWLSRLSFLFPELQDCPFLFGATNGTVSQGCLQSLPSPFTCLSKMEMISPLPSPPLPSFALPTSPLPSPLPAFLPSFPFPFFLPTPFPHTAAHWGAQGTQQFLPICYVMLCYVMICYVMLYGFRCILWYAWQVQKFLRGRNLANRRRNKSKTWRHFPLPLTNW